MNGHPDRGWWVVDQGQAVQLAPTDAELERAITSVPGVVSAGIDRSGATGGSRMRLRLAPGEDEEAVAWAVAATLRERFGIALDPDAIRPRALAAPDPAEDPVHVVQALDAKERNAPSDGPAAARSDAPTDASADVPSADVPSGSPDAVEADAPDTDLRDRLMGELAETRERLRAAAARALDGVADLTDVAELSGVADLVDVAELMDATEVDDPRIDAEATDLPPTDRAATDLPEMGELVALDTATEASATPAALEATSREDTNGEREPRSAGRTVIPRAVIRDLQVRRDVSSVQVVVVLDHAGRTEEGHASSVPTSHGTLRAVAEATVAALRALTEGSLLVGIDRVSAKVAGDAPIATVVLSLLTRRGEERLLGASMVRDGAERAVMRATLDALNRRVTPMLLEQGAELGPSR